MRHDLPELRGAFERGTFVQSLRRSGRWCVRDLVALLLDVEQLHAQTLGELFGQPARDSPDPIPGVVFGRDVVVELKRWSLVSTLRRHPDWRLSDLLELMHGDTPTAARLSGLSLADLLADMPTLRVFVPREDPPINRRRLAAAARLEGPGFDRLVFEVISEVDGRWVGSPFIAARVGGPRWKLQAALGRLVAAGRVERRGKTNDSKYRLPGVWVC